ncbi:MAG TPA: hypothetical protein DEB17_02065, partial [Chlorobaculum sp.]|nr:hypothetical protein [Chlorobaculum sp.]
VTTLTDLGERRVLEVVEHRTTEATKELLASLNDRPAVAMETIAMMVSVSMIVSRLVNLLIFSAFWSPPRYRPWPGC